LASWSTQAYTHLDGTSFDGTLTRNATFTFTIDGYSFVIGGYHEGSFTFTFIFGGTTFDGIFDGIIDLDEGSFAYDDTSDFTFDGFNLVYTSGGTLITYNEGSFTTTFTFGDCYTFDGSFTFASSYIFGGITFDVTFECSFTLVFFGTITFTSEELEGKGLLCRAAL
jgi:hypothetical protein